MKRLTIPLIIALVVLTFMWVKKTTQYQPLEGTVIVGTTADFPPFAFRDNNDEIVGFDIDVVKEAIKRLDMQIDLLDRPFSMLLPLIQMGHIHIIAAGMTPSEERKKNIDFTQPYLTENPLMVISLKKNPINSLEELKNKDIIVNAGYTADMYMSKIPNMNIIRLAKTSDAFAALEQNKGYAFVTAAITTHPYFKTVKDIKSKFNIFTIQDTDETTALGISKKLPKQFYDKIQKALDDMESDGTIKALKQKWLVP